MTGLKIQKINTLSENTIITREKMEIVQITKPQTNQSQSALFKQKILFNINIEEKKCVLYASIYLPIYPSIYLSLPVCLSVFLSIYQ